MTCLSDGPFSEEALSWKKMIPQHKGEKGANLRHKDSRWIYVYMPVEIFVVLSLRLFLKMDIYSYLISSLVFRIE